MLNLHRPMIAFHRRRESAPFLAPAPLRDLGGLEYFHSTVRQGLYRYLVRAGRRRALLPDFCPEGIWAPVRDAGLEPGYYGVDPDLRLRPDLLADALHRHRPDVFVYIHHFGIYREENLELICSLLPPEVLLVEDFAHSLPFSGVPETGDLALYAASKLLGVADGGLVWFRDGKIPGDSGYGPESEDAAVLKSRWELGLTLEDLFVRLRPGPRLQTLARRCLGGRLDAYSLLTERYREIASPVSDRSRRVLERVDFAAVQARRRALARVYLDGLEPRLRLDLPEEAVLRQPLLAFPVLVGDQDRFHAHLARRGVLGFRLTDRWLPPGLAPSELYRRHYLLPMGHHLSDAEAGRVVAAANGYRG